jgi:tRNA pseudouridine synthase 10
MRLCESCSARLGVESDSSTESVCEACLGLSGKFGAYLDMAAKAVSGYEFSTFWLGAFIRKKVLDADAKLSEGKQGIKKAMEIYVGEGLERLTGKTATPVDPDIIATVDTINERIELRVSSAFFSGRYIKKVRTMPQSKWLCRKCSGRGCKECGFTGRMYPTSVEERIASPLIGLCEGTGSKLHALGREDIDVRMLGTGRPFVIEILSPRKRTVDLASASNEIAASGDVEAIGLAVSNKAEALRVDTSKAMKRYKALVSAEQKVEREKLDAISDLAPIELEQRTPNRVAHRRSDLVRVRTVDQIEFTNIDDAGFRMSLLAEHGTYIKEFVSGDEGRTKPSLSQLLGIQCRVAELDVTDVEFV